MPNHYEVLGVSQDATRDEIKAAVRKGIYESHPDRAGSEGTARTVAINLAWEVLQHDEARAAYDRSLLESSHTIPSTPTNEVTNFLDQLRRHVEYLAREEMRTDSLNNNTLRFAMNGLADLASNYQTLKSKLTIAQTEQFNKIINDAYTHGASDLPKNEKDIIESQAKNTFLALLNGEKEINAINTTKASFRVLTVKHQHSKDQVATILKSYLEKRTSGTQEERDHHLHQLMIISAKAGSDAQDNLIQAINTIMPKSNKADRAEQLSVIQADLNAYKSTIGINPPTVVNEEKPKPHARGNEYDTKAMRGAKKFNTDSTPAAGKTQNEEMPKPHARGNEYDTKAMRGAKKSNTDSTHAPDSRDKMKQKEQEKGPNLFRRLFK